MGQSLVLRRPTLPILVLITMVGQLAMNILLPSLPALQAAFATNYATVQLTITLFLAGIAIGQLIYGPLSDRFGRRPMVLSGIAILILGTLICILAPTIEWLILGRIIQAVGGCAGMVMGRAMVRDVYDANKSASQMAYLTMAVVVAPTLAPLIGGYLEQWFGWQASFQFVLVAGVLLLGAAWLAAHETLPPDRRRSARFSAMFASFMVLLRNPVFNGYAFQVSFSTAAYFTFLGGTPYVLISLLGGTPAELGLYFLIVSSFYICGNFGTARLAERFGIPALVTAGTLIAITGTLVMLATAIGGLLTPFSHFATMSIVAFGNGFCISAGTAGAIGADPDRVGAAAGLAGSMQIGMSALGTFIGGLLLAYFVTSAVPLIAVMVSFAVLAALSPLVFRRIARSVEHAS